VSSTAAQGRISGFWEHALSRGDTRRNYAFVSLLVFCVLRLPEALGADVDCSPTPVAIASSG
jgi:hypothetical protein